MNNSNVKHLMVLVMCCLMTIVALGLPVMSSGIFITPIAEDLGVYRGSVAVHNTITLIMKAIVSLYASKIIEHFSIKKTMVTGAILISTSTYLMGWSSSIILLNIFGFLRGIGSGLIAWVPVTLVVNNWFEKNIGLFTSIVLSFSSIGGAIFSPIFATLISSLGWQQSYRMMGFTALLLALPAMLLSYTLDPRDSGLLPYGAVEDNDSQRQVIRKSERKHLSNPLIYFFLIFALIQTLANGLPQHFPGFAESIGYSAEFGATLTSLTMVSSIIFKVGMGYISDKIGVFKTSYAIIGIMTLGYLMMTLSTATPMLYVGAILAGGLFAIPSVALVLLTKRFFGLYYFAQLYPKVTFAANVGASISISAIGFTYDFFGSYQLAFAMLMIINVISIGIIVYLRKKYLTEETSTK